MGASEPNDHPRLRRRLRLPAAATPSGETQIVVVDLALGRLPGGHNADYVAALAAAFGDRGAVVWAPDGDGWGRPAGWARRAQDVALLWLAMHPPKGRRRVVVMQAPSPWDFLTLRVVAHGRRRAVAACVLRRSGTGGSRLVERIVALAERSTRSLVRARRLWPVSDSSLLLDEVARDTGVCGTLVPIPQRGSRAVEPRTGPPVVSLLGAFRMEKGAAHYDAVLRAVTARDDAEVDVQVGEGNPLDGSAEYARRVQAAWADHPRVRLHGGFLDADEYDRIVARSDVVVLPYDTAAYGTGTSGILHEALAANAVVLTTPIAWALSEYGDHPRVRFLPALDDATLARELPAAIELGLRSRDAPPEQAEAGHDDFRGRWSEAVEAALRLTG
ncbi:MAG TPA: glycosyltransferase [Solirubrobacteraceae bacterium]|nr:glycosyltransferase [Solirubrobacteraceae bacterium]